MAGSWRLSKLGSDYLPGIDKLQGCPMVLKMKGESANTSETLRISHHRYLISEKDKSSDLTESTETGELVLTYSKGSSNVNKSYQIGALNFESIGNEFVIAIVENVFTILDKEGKSILTGFALLRLGPKSGQRSKEFYKLDEEGNGITLNAEIVTVDGYHPKLIRYLERVSGSSPGKGMVASTTCKRICDASFGWDLFEFWPSNILSSCKVSIVRAVKVDAAAAPTPTIAGDTSSKQVRIICETLWQKPATADSSGVGSTEIDATSGVVGHPVSKDLFSHSRLTEGETSVTEFIIRVEVGTTVWQVAHRYKDFDMLRQFILLQEPFNTQLKELCESKFPGKMIGLSFRHAALLNRVEGLEVYLISMLESARFCRQGSIDALLSFLQIPEQLYLAKTMSQAAVQTTSAVSVTPGQSSGGAMSLAVSKAISIFSTNKETKANANVTVDATSAGASAGPVKSTPVQPATVKDNLTLSLLIDSRRNPREILLTRLLHGILVIKHGRQGNPKKRVLRCDATVTMLMWSAPGPDAEKRKSLPMGSASGSSDASEASADKLVVLKEVQSVRMGTEIDPTCNAAQADSGISSPDSVQARSRGGGEGKRSAYTNDDSVSVADTESVFNDNQSVAGSAAHGQKAVKRRSSLFFTSPAAGDKTYTGTATLRRHVKQEDLSLCFSLILPTRSFDIQCLEAADFDFLFYNLKDLCTR
eukprot:gene33296-43051_t